MSAALHEAAHAACATLLDRRVEYVWCETGHSLPGDTIGQCRAPTGGRLDLSQVVLAVVGYMREGHPDWPPSYEQARDERRESLGLLIRHFGLDRQRYDDLIDVARDMLADPTSNA